LRFELENYSEAIKLYTQILNLAKQTNNRNFTFQSINMIAYIYSYIKDYDKAIEKYLSVLDSTKFNELHDAHAANNISDGYMNKKMYTEALKYVQISKKINEKRQAAQKDGMDIALCIINTENLEMSYAGAYNSAFIVKDKQLIELKADKQPVGVYYREKPFNQQHITLQANDRIYLYSDGFIDQFGGENGSKYLKNNFTHFVLSIQETVIEAQRELFRSEYHQ